MIVGLVGNIGVGKTTAQKHIELRGFKAYNMAGPLKKMARCLGFTETECYGTQEQKLTPNAFLGCQREGISSKIWNGSLPGILAKCSPPDEFCLGSML